MLNSRKVSYRFIFKKAIKNLISNGERMFYVNEKFHLKRKKNVSMNNAQ